MMMYLDRIMTQIVMQVEHIFRLLNAGLRTYIYVLKIAMHVRSSYVILVLYQTMHLRMSKFVFSSKKNCFFFQIYYCWSVNCHIICSAKCKSKWRIPFSVLWHSQPLKLRHSSGSTPFQPNQYLAAFKMGSVICNRYKT